MNGKQQRYEVRLVPIEYGNPSYQVWDTVLGTYTYWTSNPTDAHRECDKLNGTRK